MTEAKSRISIMNDGLAQYAAAEMLRQGHVRSQIRKILSVYRKKRDLMLETMEVSFPDESEWDDPKGGLFIWTKMPAHVNTTGLLEEAMKRGVAYIPGNNFYLTPVHNFMRLNFSLPSEEDIVEGIQILGGLLKEYV
jgi:2-aminoadipate transaminase